MVDRAGDERDVAAQLAAANARLKAARVRVKIERRGDFLSLRATLPPQPGSARTKPHDQRISLGLAATPTGVERAEGEAYSLRGDLTRGSFSWADWRDTAQTERTAAEWLALWKAHLMESSRFRRAVRPEEKWITEQWCCGLSGLIMNAPVNESNCRQAVEQKHGKRSRPTAGQVLTTFAAFCGVAVNLKDVAGIYQRSKIERTTPTTQGVVDGYHKIPAGSVWRGFYAIAAAYGLRPLEVFAGQFKIITLPNHGEVLAYEVLRELPPHRRPAHSGGDEVIQQTKTGPRIVPPLIDVFIKEFNINQNIILPNITVRHGAQASAYFRRYELGFTAYDLRHHFNFYGTTILGYSSEVMALFLGHKPNTNRVVYQRGLNSEWALKSFDQNFVKLKTGD